MPKKAVLNCQKCNKPINKKNLQDDTFQRNVTNTSGYNDNHWFRTADIRTVRMIADVLSATDPDLLPICYKTIIGLHICLKYRVPWAH